MTSNSNDYENKVNGRTCDSLSKFVNSLSEGFELLELIFDIHGNVVDFRFLEVNPAYENQTGLKAANIIGKLKKENAPAREQRWYDYAIKAVKTGKILNYEYYNDKINRCFETQFIPISTNQIAVLFRDITERKKIEEESSRNSRRISEIIESISDDFMVLDKNWNYVYANSQAAKLVGLEPKNIVGKNFWELFPQNRRTFIEENLQEAMKKKEIRRFELFGQYSHKCKLITTYPSVDGIVLIAADITERKLLEQQLQEKERLAAIGQTAGMVGHDIRNPLQAIAGDLYLIENDIASLQSSETKKSLQESAKSIQGNLMYIAKIVEDLQDYARALKPSLDLVRVDKVIEEVMLIVPVESNHQVIFDIATDLPAFSSDFSMLKRIITNLVQNAIQAMPTSGNLTIHAYHKDSRIFISVEDTGIGIPEEIKSKIFMPMMTTKSKGQGLGLAVVKRLVEALNGKISFESQERKGTTFTIEFPLSDSKRMQK